jgi:tetratricopeptide (TPR) repeat protein
VTPQAAADAATTQLLGGQLDAATTQLLLSIGTQGGGGTGADAGGAQNGGALQVAGAQGAGTERLRRAARGAQREAVRGYRTALALHPAYPEAYRNLGSVLKERRATHSAAVRNNRDRATSPPRAGLVPLHPPPPRQVRAYREATRLVPTDRASLLNLGELLQWLGRADAANITYALAVSRGIWAHPQQRPGHLVPALEARPWWPTDTYSFVATLLRHYREVRAEGLKLLREAQFDDYKSPALTSGRWD